MATAAVHRPRPAAPLVLWHAIRPFSLVIAAAPVVMATAALVPQREVSVPAALGCLVVAVLLQGGTNALNDAEDASTGADDVETAMPSLAIRAGWVDPRSARLIAVGCFAAASALGVALALAAGKPALLALGAVGLVIGVVYTAPPVRLAYRPLGEIASAIPMGIGIPWGTAALQAGSVPASVWWCSVPLALLTAGVLHANNARDRAHDSVVGKRTLATYLSPAAVVWEYRLLTLAVPVVIVAGIAVRQLPWECVVALVPGALAVEAARAARTGLDAMGWTLLLLRCVRLHLLTSVTLTAGLLLGAIG